MSHELQHGVHKGDQTCQKDLRCIADHDHVTLIGAYTRCKQHIVSVMGVPNMARTYSD